MPTQGPLHLHELTWNVQDKQSREVNQGQQTSLSCSHREQLSLFLTLGLLHTNLSICKRHTSSPISHTTPITGTGTHICTQKSDIFPSYEDYHANITVLSVQVNVLRKPGFPSIMHSSNHCSLPFPSCFASLEIRAFTNIPSILILCSYFLFDTKLCLHEKE